MTRWIATSIDRERFHTFVPEKREFFVRKFSYLQQEGIGALGSLYLRGSVAVHGNQLFVSAMGHTAAMTLPEYKDSIEFFASVRLLHAGKPVVHKRLAVGANQVWPDDEYAAIGSASISLPPTGVSDAYSLVIEGFYTFGSGVGYNSSSIARETIRIIGVKQ
ncbi:hypothetical protein ACFOZ5_13855 [Marinobacter lacisalsi]|uniref:Uncharacterized protein n=1 Tax=Marinobacter lacisalsi TaxID=475979 RepID=A0ABV8QM05_9GAMM